MNSSTALNRSILAQKEKLVKDAITHVLGERWAIEDVAQRGLFERFEGGREVFKFDGQELIEFCDVHPVVGFQIPLDHKIVGRQSYKNLY